MSFLTKIADFATNGFGSFAMGVVEKYFPPDMSEEQKATMQLGFKQLELETQKEMNKAVREAEIQLNDRIKMYEGSASDLLRLPVIGRFMIFLRGCQRPIWGFSTLWMNWLWFSEWTLNEKQESALIVINFLVLGFLFGERAIKNVAPLITQLLSAKKAK